MIDKSDTFWAVAHQWRSQRHAWQVLADVRHRYVTDRESYGTEVHQEINMALMSLENCAKALFARMQHDSSEFDRGKCECCGRTVSELIAEFGAGIIADGWGQWYTSDLPNRCQSFSESPEPEDVWLPGFAHSADDHAAVSRMVHDCAYPHEYGCGPGYGIIDYRSNAAREFRCRMTRSGRMDPWSEYRNLPKYGQ